MKKTTKIEKVYSPINDRHIKANLNDSLIWKTCFHQDELKDAREKHKTLYCYSIKFDGLKPIQVTKISKL